MAGFADVPGTEIIVFIQRWCQQDSRVTNDHQTGDNTIAIDGNFDDAQTNVKHMFNDVALQKIDYQQVRNFHQPIPYEHWPSGATNCLLCVCYAQLVKTGEIVAGEKLHISATIYIAFVAQIGLPN